MSMFCQQCEQTFRMEGCDSIGVCGKTPEVATLQDVLIHSLKAASIYGWKLRELGDKDKSVDYFVLESVFATLTNVNFDADDLEKRIYSANRIKTQLKEQFEKLYQEKNGTPYSDELPSIVHWIPAESREGLLDQGKLVGIRSNNNLDEDIHSLRDILLYGIKGMSAYAHHAYRLGQQDEKVTGFVYKALYSLSDESLGMDDLLALVMECGEANLKCLEILDRGHTTKFGHPEPTQVKLGYKKGKAIIISGHEMQDLALLLEQTKDKGIKIYTHGEMLPGLAYPEFKKYPHFAGHYGSAWQNQQKEFDNIPAAILMTTNCIQEPSMTYSDRIFTTGAVAWPNIKHISEGTSGSKDFTPVIEKALELEGFTEDNIEKEITIGFAHNAVLNAAELVVDAVKAKKIRHFFLIGGCDGARPGRNYFTKYAETIPDDCLILTLGCGKNRINRLDYPEVAGLPKLLDCGQCNDAYSAVVIAQTLAKAFDCGVNDLPLSLIISWYEQKAVAVLLTLFHLGIKNIKLGPTLPAFVSKNVLNVLVEKFNIQPITTVEKDIQDALGESLDENLQTA
ncbi:Hydroxylamine reductase [hydrothermal vent metagenome]|uniref:Hydroxylamine reductase n=1 Tax=hydrothermal vent metagenome TaxID=652676 RepID=A0A3B1DEW3_9ZZZZ